MSRVSHEWVAIWFIFVTNTSQMTNEWVHRAAHEVRLLCVHVTNEPRVSHEWATSELRMSREWVTNEARVSHEWATNELWFDSFDSFVMNQSWLRCASHSHVSADDSFIVSHEWVMSESQMSRQWVTNESRMSHEWRMSRTRFVIHSHFFADDSS